MQIKHNLLSIGVPVRNEEDNIPRLIVTLENLCEELLKLGVETEIIVNENCSKDNSLNLLEAWKMQNSTVIVNRLSFPVSFQESIVRLMELAKGDAFVVFQSDMQDPAEVVIEFVKVWLSGATVVAGVAIKRSENIIDRSTRRFFYFVLKKLSDGQIIPGFQEFYLVNRMVYEQLRKLPKQGAFLRGHISSSFGQIHKVEYQRLARQYGKSKFDFPSKYTLALDGLLLFGTKFVRFVSVLSFAIFIISLLSSTTLIAMHYLGIKFGTQGWASQVVVLLIVLSLFGLVSGLILEYLIRIYRFLIFSRLH